MMNTAIAHLSDSALDAELLRLARTEHDATVALVEHLAELGVRRSYLGAGFSSLFEYCRERLALSEGEAYNRSVAARAARKFPVVLQRLADGSVNLTTIRLLFKHLTAENHLELLDASLHKSKRDVERLIAARFPQPALPLSVRKVPSEPALVASNVPAVPTALALPATSPAPSRPLPPASASPSAADQYHVRFTASGATWEKLQAAQDLLRHAIPSGDVSEIFGRALDLLLEDLARKKFGAATRPRPSKETKKDSRHIQNEVKRVVWVRDSGRCAFIGTSGRRCTERSRLEFHHVHPYADGGAPTVENIQLRCQRHNLYESERHYGPIREAMATVGEASPGWDVSAILSKRPATSAQRAELPATSGAMRSFA
jgi:hypothetical protein